MTVADEEFNEHSTLHLILEGHELVDVGGWFGSTDPFFMLQAPIPTSSGSVIWQTVYTSAEIENSLNPRWKKAQINLHQLCQNNIHKPIRIKVIDWEPSEKHNNMGYFDTTVADLLLVSGDASKTAPLKDGDEDFGKLVVRLARIKTPRPDKVDARRKRDSSNHSRRSTKSSRSIRFEDILLDEEGLSDKTALWYLTLEGKDLTDVSGWFETPDPYFQICIPAENPQDGKVVWQTVCRSRHIVDSLNPVWSEVPISLYLLCGEDFDLNKHFRVFVFDNVDGGKPTPMGFFESTVKEMMKAAKDDQKVFTLIDSKGTEFGKMSVLHAQLPDTYSDSSRSGSPVDENNESGTTFNNSSIPLTIMAANSTEDNIVDRSTKGEDSKDREHSKGMSSSAHSASSKHERRSPKTTDSSRKRTELSRRDSYKKLDSSSKSKESSRHESSDRRSSHSRRSISLDFTRDEKRRPSHDAEKKEREYSDHSTRSRSYRSSRSKSMNDSVTKEHRISQSKSLKNVRRTLSTKTREKEESDDYSSRRKSYKKYPSFNSLKSDSDKTHTALQPDPIVPEVQTAIPAEPKLREQRDSEKEKEPKTESSPVTEMSPKPKFQHPEMQPLHLRQRTSSSEIASSDPEAGSSPASTRQVLRSEVDVPSHDQSVALQQTHQQSADTTISKDEILPLLKEPLPEFQAQNQEPDNLVSKFKVPPSSEAPISAGQKDEMSQASESSSLQSQDKVIEKVELLQSLRSSLSEVKNPEHPSQDQVIKKDAISKLAKASPLEFQKAQQMNRSASSTNQQSLESACSSISDHLLILSEQSQQSPGKATQREETLPVPSKVTLKKPELLPGGQVFSTSSQNATSLEADPSIPPRQNSQLSSVAVFPKEETPPPPKSLASSQANEVQQTSVDPYAFLPKHVRQSLKSLDAPSDSQFISPYQQYLIRKKEKLSFSKKSLEMQETTATVPSVPFSTLSVPQEKERNTDDDALNAPVSVLNPKEIPSTASNVDGLVPEIKETQHQGRSWQSKVSDEASAMLRLERKLSDIDQSTHTAKSDAKVAALCREVDGRSDDKIHSFDEPATVPRQAKVGDTSDSAAKEASSDPQTPVKKDLTKNEHEEVALMSSQNTHCESNVVEKADDIRIDWDEEDRLPGKQVIHNSDVPVRIRATNLVEPDPVPNSIANLQEPDQKSISNEDTNLEEPEKETIDDVGVRGANEDNSQEAPTNILIDREMFVSEEDLASLGQASQSNESDSSFDPELSYLFDVGASITNVSIDSALLREGSTIHFCAASGLRLDSGPDCDGRNAKSAPFFGRNAPDSNLMATKTDGSDPELGAVTEATVSIEGAWPSVQILETQGPLPTKVESLKSNVAAGIVAEDSPTIRQMNFGPKLLGRGQAAAANQSNTKNLRLDGPTLSRTYRDEYADGDAVQPRGQTDDTPINDDPTKQQKEIQVSTTSPHKLPQTESILPRDNFHECREEKRNLGGHAVSENHPSNDTFEDINDAATIAVALGDERPPTTKNDRDLTVPKTSITSPQITGDQEKHHQSLAVSTLVDVPVYTTARGQNLSEPIHLLEERSEGVGDSGLLENASLDLFVHEDSMNKANMLFHLKVAAKDLQNMGGWFGSTNAYIEIARWESSPYSSPLWHNVYRSENIEDSLSPEWKEVDLPLKTLCNGDLDSKIQICLFHWIKQEQHVPMGSFETTVTHLLQASKSGGSFDLVERDRKYGVLIVLDACVNQKDDSPKQQILSIREKEPQLLLHLQGRNMVVEKGWFGTPDIRFQVAASIENKDGSLIWQPVYVSDYVENSLNPSWNQAEIDLEILCGCNLEKPVRLSFADRGDGFTLNPMGYFDTTISDLIGATKAFIAAEEGKEFGSIIIRKALVDPPLSIVPIRSKTSRSTPSKAPSPQPEALSPASNIAQGPKNEFDRNEGRPQKSGVYRILKVDRTEELTGELKAEDTLRLSLLAKPEKEKEEIHQEILDIPNKNEYGNHNTETSQLLMEQASLLEQNMQERGILLDYSKNLTVQVSSLEESLVERDKLLNSASKKVNLLLSEKNSLEVEVACSSKYLEDLRDARNKLEDSLIDTKAEILSYKRELDKALKKLEYAERQNMAATADSETVEGPNEGKTEGSADMEEDGTGSETRSAVVEISSENAVNTVVDDSIAAAESPQVQAALMAESKETIAVLAAEKDDLSELVETLEQRLSIIEREAHERAVADSRTLVTSQTENSLLDRKTLETSLSEAQVKVRSYANAMVIEESKMRAMNEEKEALSKKASSFKKVAEKNLATVQEAKDLLAKYRSDRKKQSQQKASLKKALKEAKASTKAHLKKWTEAQKRLSKLEKSVVSRNKLIEKAKLRLKDLKAQKTKLESTISALKDTGGTGVKSGVKGEASTSILESSIPIGPKSTTEFLKQADKRTLVSKIKELETHFEDVAKQRQAAVTAKKLYEGFWKDAKDEYVKLQGGAKGKVAGAGSKWGEFEEDPFKNLPEVDFDKVDDADVTDLVGQQVEKMKQALSGELPKATEGAKVQAKDKKSGKAIGKQGKKRKNAKKNAQDSDPESGTSTQAKAHSTRGAGKRGRKPTVIRAARARQSQRHTKSKRRSKGSSKHPMLHSETKKSQSSTRRRPSSVKDSKLKNLAPVGVNVSRMNTAQIRRTGHRVARTKQRRPTDIVKEQLKQQTQAAVEIMEEDDVQLRGHENTEDITNHDVPNKEEQKERKTQKVSTVLEEIDEETDEAGVDSVSQITAATSVTSEKHKRSYFSFGRKKSKSAMVAPTEEPSSSGDEAPPLPPRPSAPPKPPKQGERDDNDSGEETSAVDGTPKSSKSFFKFGKKKQATAGSVRSTADHSEAGGDDADQMSGSRREWWPKTPKTPQSMKKRLSLSGGSSHQDDSSTMAGDEQTTVAGSAQSKVPASPQLSKATKKFFKFGLTNDPGKIDPKEEVEEVETDSELQALPSSSGHTSASGKNPRRKRRSISQLKMQRSDSGSVCNSEESMLEESELPKRRGRRPQAGKQSTKDGTRPPRGDTERPKRRPVGRAGRGSKITTTSRRSKGQSDNAKEEASDKRKKKNSSLNVGSAHSVKSLSAPDTNIAQRHSLLSRSEHSADNSQQKDPKRSARLSRIQRTRSSTSKEKEAEETEQEEEEEEEKREIEAEKAAVAEETEDE